MITRRSALAGLSAGLSAGFLAAAHPLGRPAAAQDVDIPDPEVGEPVVARRVPGELAERALALPALVPAGAVGGDVVFVEFFDYNCPYCRASAAHIAPLVARPGVGVLLANYPILSDASREAAAIALGVLALAGPEAYLPFHAALFASRGLVDGARALDVAQAQGLDPDALGRAAALPGIDPAIEDILQVGRVLGFDATPSTLVGPWAYEGYLTHARKERIVADLRA